MRLVDGAQAILGDLPAASTHVVEVPLEAGDELGTGVSRAGSLRIVRERTLEALGQFDDWALTIGGDCGVELASVEHAIEREDGDVALVWFDAHPDLNSPTSSGTGAFHGMVLRALTGEGVPGLVPVRPLAEQRIVLAGVRSADEAENDFITESAIGRVGVDDLETPDALVAAVEATGATSVYIHIDLDALDPGEIAGIGFPEPFGIPAARLVASIRALTARFRIAGAGITEFAPASTEEANDDLPTILRLIGALTASTAAGSSTPASPASPPEAGE